jgi:hypothetical protein
MSGDPSVLPSGGARVPYDALPSALRSWVDGALASPVVSADTQHGGFSPGAAARLRCADGTRAFVKAVSADVNPESPTLHRREASVLATLPRQLPVPRLLATYDDDPWVALLIEDVEGRHPCLPWRPDELALVVDALREISAVTDVGLPALGPHVDEWRGWRELADDPDDELDAWAAVNLDALAALEADIVAALPPSRLQHSDTRADNTLLQAGRAWLVDWPWAGLAPPWFDVVLLAPSVAMQGGPPPQELLEGSRLASASDKDAVTVLVAAMSGFFLNQARKPAPPGLPALRGFQAAQGRVALDWLRERTRW